MQNQNCERNQLCVQHANMQFSNEKPSLTKSVQSEKKSEGMSASEGGRSGGVFLHWGDGGM